VGICFLVQQKMIFCLFLFIHTYLACSFLPYFLGLFHFPPSHFTSQPVGVGSWLSYQLIFSPWDVELQIKESSHIVHRFFFFLNLFAQHGIGAKRCPKPVISEIVLHWNPEGPGRGKEFLKYCNEDRCLGLGTVSCKPKTHNLMYLQVIVKLTTC
jgi:hypothetical protein